MGVSVAVADTIYILGGIKSDYANSRNFNITTLKFDSQQNAITNAITNTAPQLNRDSSHAYALGDNKTIVLANVQYPNINVTNAQSNTTIELRTSGISFYDIPSNTWTNPQLSPALQPLPPLRRATMTAISPENDAIYVMGGAYIMDNTPMPGIFRYDLKNTSSIINMTAVDTNLKINTIGASSDMLPDGVIVIAFGMVSFVDRTLLDASQVTLFDTRKNKIYSQNVTGNAPAPRFAAGSALGPDKSTIYYYGGGDQAAARNPLTGGATPNLVALDTTTWTWVYPKISGLAAVPYIYSTLTLLENTKLVTALGLVGSVFSKDIGVINNVPQSASQLQDSSMQWFTNNEDTDKYSDPAYNRKKQSLSEGAIAGIVVAVLLIVVLILALTWRRFPRIRAIGMYIQNEIIWHPRSGEPLWAETARLLVRFILLFLFIAFVAYSVYRSVQSPVVVQEIREPTDMVQVPDIRFCYDGFNVSSTTPPLNVFCAFRNGTDCSNQIIRLNMSNHLPQYPDQLGAVACFMFLSAPSYSLMNDNMGYSESTSTKMVFSFQGPPRLDTNGNISSSGAIYIDMYAPGYNPNVVAYKLLPSNQLSPEFNREWAISEQGSNTIDSIILKPSVRTSASFAIIENRALRRSDGWNYVGFSSTYDVDSTVSSFYKDAPQNIALLQTSSLLAQLTVQPSSFTININNEQKVFTLLNAFAQIGGVLGLFIAVQTILFGFRPQSPWGIVHRWSFGRLRIQLTDRLANYFDRMGTPVPLVNPVSSRLSTVFKNSAYGSGHAVDEAMSQENRVHQVEERLQLMELLLKSYYLNDEVFRSLDQAVKRGNDEKRRISMGGIKRSSTDSVLVDTSNEVLELSSNTKTDEESASTLGINRRPSGTVFPQQRGIYQPGLAPSPYDL
ncbi:uncharacterized protein ATC70_000867 [Mucor velutinosus]|uniref:Uncharacterized protein n=1 Tax=Mucor velutinosus TaxID=708070 RepID=A0AAN7DIR7_9FUNG|nr:hypothetical protein ATC70_000867 [Mucor velutinosus]